MRVQKGQNNLYADYFILGRIILAENVLEDVDSFECLPDKLKIIRPLYDPETGNFKGLKNTTGLINVRGDQEEVFFNYRNCDNKSKVLYCVQRRQVLDIFTGETFSTKIFFLSTTTDRKEKINQHKANVSLIKGEYTLH